MIRLIVPLDRIDDNPYQTRTAYDQAALDELAADIQGHGLLQVPIGRIVTPDGKLADLAAFDAVGGPAVALVRRPELRVQLAFGHRRLRACRQLAAVGVAFTTGLPLDVQAELDDVTMATMAWSENAQRKDVTPVEEAQAIQRMLDAFGWTQAQVAEHIGLGRPTVANKLRLLRLPAKILAKLNAGEVSERQAIALLPLAELPSEFVADADRKDSPGWCSWKPSDLIEQAATTSSDEIRRRVNELVRAKAALLSELPVGLLGFAFDDKGLKSPTCEACPIRINYADKLYCGRPDCLKIKQTSWRAMRLRLAAEACGIPVATVEPSYDNSENLAADWELTGLQEVGCPHLRLYYSYGHIHPQGFPDVTIGVMFARDAKCKHLSAVRAAHTRAFPDPEQVSLKRRRAEVDALVETAAAAFKLALAANNPGAWHLLYVRSWYGSGSISDAKQLSVADIWGRIANHVIKNFVPWQGQDDPDAVCASIQRYFAEVGLPDPFASTPQTPPAEAQPAPAATDDGPLGKARTKLERVLLWIDRSRTQTPSREAIHGNMDNLDSLQAELMDLGLDFGDNTLVQLREAIDELQGWLDKGAPGTLSAVLLAEEIDAELEVGDA
jgi:ParB/RepB/Spo0J family partition protein